MLPWVLLHCTRLRFTSHTISKGRSSRIILLVRVTGVLLILSLIIFWVDIVVYVSSAHIRLCYELLDLLQLRKDIRSEDAWQLVIVLDWRLSWHWRLSRLILELLALEIWLVVVCVANRLSIWRRILVMRVMIHHFYVQVQVYDFYAIHFTQVYLRSGTKVRYRLCLMVLLASVFRLLR